MATQKQRRRRAKEKRHDYDLVEIDEEGNETILTSSDLKEQGGSRPAAGTRSSSKQSSSSTSNAKRSRGTPQPPSWRRVAKRSALFAPIFLATVLLISGDRLSFAGAVVQTLLLLAFFVPVSYFMDRIVWRSYEKRLARSK
jgi:hypothetical protein